MLKSCFVLVVFLLGFNNSYSQYLGIDDFKSLLDVAEDRIEAEKFLKMNGFVFSDLEYILEEDDDEDDTSYYRVDYYKMLSGDEYYIRVLADRDEDIYIIMEFSSNEDRSYYFADVLAAAGLEPVKEWNNGDGDEGFDFKAADYLMTISKKPNDDGEMRYHFSIASY